MKTHYKSPELAHAWFHALSPRGTSPGSMSFEGDSFYSYGTVIGRKIQHKGKSAVLVNVADFSSSTSRHHGEMQGAIPHGVPMFRISEGRGARLNHTPLQIFQHQLEQYAECLKEAATARQSKTRERLEGAAAKWLERAQEVAQFFGLKRKVDQKAVQRLASSKQRAEAAQERKERLQADARRALAQKDYDAWKAGKEVTRGAFHDFPVAFRIEGKELVSSLGARVPVKDAKRALRFIKSHKGQEWRENGETCPVGGYRVQSISAVGIVAGCHRITWEEIQRVEPLLA